MGDLISREALLAAIDNERKLLIEQGRLGAEHVVVHHARRLIEDLPAIDAAPVVHARWTKKNDQGVFYCSECDLPSLHRWPYCESCGARMDGGEHDATD